MTSKAPLRFHGVPEVDAWAVANGGEDGVHRLLIRRGEVFAFHDTMSVKYAERWLELQRTKRADASEAASRAIAERTAKAAEDSARAAEDSARSAKLSVLWSRISVFIALAALAVSAWPHIWEWFR